MANHWKLALALNAKRELCAGSRAALAAAVGRGADLRGYTSFDYAEHMGVPDSAGGLIQEMMSFGVVYLLAGAHVAGIQTTRYPANCSLGFGDYPSLSFFLNNDCTRNGVARLYLAGGRGAATPVTDLSGKFRPANAHDQGTGYPSENFTYDFNEYGFWVRDDWQEVLAHDAAGRPLRGSLKALQDQFRAGADLKVAVCGLCEALRGPAEPPLAHELFVRLHSVYNHEDAGFLGGESEPLVRVAPAVPLAYRSGNWNCGWILPRTDGVVHQVIINPATGEFSRTEGRFPIRWLVR